MVDVGATMSRVSVVGNYFVITFLSTVSSNPSFRYFAIPFNTPSAPMSPVTISTAISSISAAYDVLSVEVNSGIIYLAWEDSGVLRLNQLSNTLILGTPVVQTSSPADLISLAWDYSNRQLWVSFYDSGSHTINAAAYSSSLGLLLGSTLVVSSITLNNGLTSTALAGTLNIFYEVSNFYSYDSSLRTDYLATNTCTILGVAGTPSIILRGVGLSSKAIISNGVSYMLICYSSVYQPSYFLINASGKLIGKVAYSNGSGYIINQILPQINVSTNSDNKIVFQIGYLFKDFLASIANPAGPMGSNVGTNKTMGASVLLYILKLELILLHGFLEQT